MTARAPAAAIWALGLTQIVGYGTLFYSFSILAPAMAADFGWPQQWVFGALSASLFVSGLLAPMAGRLGRPFRRRPRHVGRLGRRSAALLACALRRDAISFAAALVAMEMASCFVLYSTAFVAIVQSAIGDAHAQHHASDADRRLCVDTVLAADHVAARLSCRGARSMCCSRALNLVLCLPIHLG